MKDIDSSLIAIFLKNKKEAEATPILKRVVSIKEAIEMLDTSNSSIRRSIEKGDFSEEKEDFRRIGSSVFFDLEAILNRKYMDSETYWRIKDMYELEKMNKEIFQANGSLDNINDAPRSLEEVNQEILEKVNFICKKLNDLEKKS